MMKVYLLPMMEKERFGKKNKNHFDNLKEKGKELWYLNFLYLLEDYVSLTLCLMINFFKIKTGFLIKIKTLVITVLSYLSTIKIITEMKTK